MGTADLTSLHCVSVPRKPSTLEHHRKQIRRWASALVHDGFPIKDLIDLSVLVIPKNFRRAMHYYTKVWCNDDADGDADGDAAEEDTAEDDPEEDAEEDSAEEDAEAQLWEGREQRLVSLKQ